mgnify:FL=1
MSNYRGHLFGGSLLYLAVLFIFSLYSFDLSMLSLWFLSILLGSLFPDVDTKSKGQKIFYRFALCSILLLLIFQKFAPALIFSIASFMPVLVRHRGIFHNIWFSSGLVGCMILVLSQLFVQYKFMIFSCGAFFLLGIFSHLVLDFGLKRFLGFKKY